MKTYIVKCGYRTDDGMLTSAPTHFEDVTVSARDIYEARAEAIDAMYAKHGNKISHVQPSIPREVET